jgi:phage terminase large subunit-like protein
MRTHTAEFTQAAEMVQKEIESASFRHDGSSVLQRHVTNARRRPNRWGISIGKEAPKSPRKIDAAVAMIIARQARRLVLGSKQWKERAERSRTGKGGKVWSWS